ncbi:ubiquinol-cytochrome C chaperone family protein [Helicobacter pylori]|nr:YaaW family protein [Helicobacter pylori]OOP83786.1 ubiquinol-cytochrome C chaperone family protein [Helicobacter pylori]
MISSTEYQRYGHDYAKYPRKIAEELQRYGGNSFMNFFRNEGVLYKEILCDACDHLDINYNERSATSLIEQNMLSKLLKDSLEKMSRREIKELCDGLGMTNIDKVIGENKQVLIASVLTLFKAGGSHSYALAVSVADAMVRQTLGHGLSSVVGKVVLKKTLGILAGPIGWVITGALVSINLAGPAYRVTVPACVLVATLRKKLKAEQEAEQARLKAEQAEQEAKLKAEQEADKTEKMWYLAIISIVLIGLAVLAVFYMKGKHHSSNNPNNNPKSGVEKLKNPSRKN